MQSKDFHQRYFHPHYLLCWKIYVQSDGTILAMSGNVCLTLNPDELQDLINGVLDYARVYAALHSGDRLVVTS